MKKSPSHLLSLSLMIIWHYYRDAGFVHESFRNETNRIFWDFWSYEMNPRNESLENRPTKRIHNTNLWKTGLRNECTIQIFKVWIRESGFASLPAWICKDLFCAIVLNLSGFVRICWIRENRSNLWKFRSLIESTIWIFKNRTHESGFAKLWSWIRQSWNQTNLFGVRICDYNTKRIHVFTNLLYDFRILSFSPQKMKFKRTFLEPLAIFTNL